MMSRHQRFYILVVLSIPLGLQSKMTVYAAIAAMLVLMAAIVYYGSLDNPALEQAQIELSSVEVKSVNTIQNRAILEVVFLVSNPSDVTFTVPSISYELYGDEQYIGAGQYSTEDIAMPGRAAFYGGTSIPLKSTMTIGAADSSMYGDIVNERISSYSVTGMMVVESAWALVEKEFEYP